MSVSLTFPDSTYSSTNKPSSDTLKSDLAIIETAINALPSSSETLTNKAIAGDTNTLTKLSAAWPIGSVYISVVATDPATLLGFGTWASIAAGRMLIGLDSGDTQFDTVEETGGAETVTLTTTELPAHTHTVSMQNTGSGSTGTGAWEPGGSEATSSAGSGAAFSIMNPYYVVYMWKRTA